MNREISPFGLSLVPIQARRVAMITRCAPRIYRVVIFDIFCPAQPRHALVLSVASDATLLECVLNHFFQHKRLIEFAAGGWAMRS